MRVFFVFIVALGVLISCNNDEFSTGAQFFDGISFELTTWDTLSLKMSTVKFDSVVTSSSTRILAGKIDSPDYGKLVASTYFQLTPDSTGYDLDDVDVAYDSITLILTYDSYYLNDTSSEYSLEVYEVTEDMDSDDDENGYFYNTTNYETSSLPIGDVTLPIARPLSEGAIEITLSDETGTKIFNEALLGSDNSLTNPRKFISFFKGLKIVPTGNTNAIIGFEIGAELRVYYTNKEVVPSEQGYLRFSNQNDIEVSFNHFDTDFSGSTLNSLTDEDSEIESSETNEQVYIQSGAGIGARVEIPYLKSILEANPDLLIDNVTLRLKPVKNIYASDSELPEKIYVYYVDKNNQLISTETYLEATLKLDEEFDIDTYYILDITDFIEMQLALQENNNNALFIVLTQETYGSSAHYLTLGDQNNKDFQAQINLNLIQLKND